MSSNNSNNTYCELCNARFSNVESYAAHMRNCHPARQQQQQQQQALLMANHNNSNVVVDNKMPYLTSILSTPSTNGGKTILGGGGGVVTKPTLVSATSGPGGVPLQHSHSNPRYRELKRFNYFFLSIKNLGIYFD
jgi:hypothetical protein